MLQVSDVADTRVPNSELRSFLWRSQWQAGVPIQVVWTKEDQPSTVKINQENVRWEDLEGRLAKIYLTRAEKVVFVRGDADVGFQYVADVIDVAHHAGVERVGLLTMDREVAGE
jgi:biopolymer transport protein ExbD